MKVTGVVFNTDGTVKNGIKYEKDAFTKAVGEFEHRKRNGEDWFGELLPSCRTDNMCVNLQNISHRIDGLEIYDEKVVCEAELLDTPSGKFAQELLAGGVCLEFNPRVLGTVKEVDDGCGNVEKRICDVSVVSIAITASVNDRPVVSMEDETKKEA